MPRVSQVGQYGRPEYSAVRCLLFGANLTDVGMLRYVCLLFPDGKNILARSSGPGLLSMSPDRRNSISNQQQPAGFRGLPRYWVAAAQRPGLSVVQMAAAGL